MRKETVMFSLRRCCRFCSRWWSGAQFRFAPRSAAPRSGSGPSFGNPPPRSRPLPPVARCFGWSSPFRDFPTLREPEILACSTAMSPPYFQAAGSPGILRLHLPMAKQEPEVCSSPSTVKSPRNGRDPGDMEFPGFHIPRCSGKNRKSGFPPGTEGPPPAGRTRTHEAFAGGLPSDFPETADVDFPIVLPRQ